MNGILYAQSSTPSDTSGVWYSNKQDLNCLRCLLSEVKKDSILSIREKEVKALKQDYDDSVKFIEDLRLESILKDEEIVKLKNHRKALLSISGGLAAVVVILVAI